MAGLLCAVGGVGWLVNGLAFPVFSRPDGAAFAAAEVAWIAVQSLLLIGVIGLAFSGAAPGWFGGVSPGIALLGRADFVARRSTLSLSAKNRSCCRSVPSLPRWARR